MEIAIGLGGNLGNVQRTFAAARSGLARVGEVRACSGLFQTRPVGPPQPDYGNAVLLLVTDLSPLAVLGRCQELEATAGRDRTGEQRWGPRPLDLDLLIACGLVHRGPRLELPHPRLARRSFALAPATEVVGDWVHPLLGQTVSALARAAAVSEPDAVSRIGEW